MLATQCHLRSCRRTVPSLLLALAVTPAFAVERISVSSAGGEGNSQSRYPTISANGRYVVFESDASTLVNADSNGATDIFLRDRLLNTTTRVSVMAGGGQHAGTSNEAAVSGDGSRIVFVSTSGLVPGSGFRNCYLLDRNSGALTIMDRRIDNGQPANEVCQSPSIDVAGGKVAFASRNANLIAAGLDTNSWADVFVREIASGGITRVNLGAGGVQANADSDFLRLSGAGSHVVYGSGATTLVSNDSNGVRDIFLSDLAGTTRRVSVGSGQTQANGASSPVSAINADGGLAAFSSNSSNLPAWNVNVESVLYLRLPDSDQTVAISVPVAGMHEGWGEEPDFSYSGRWLVFWANDQLISGVTVAGIYVVDLLEETIALVSRTPGGQPAGAGNHFNPRISADGSGIVWFSNTALLVAGDNNGTWDVFYADNPLWDDTIFANGFQP